MKYGQSYSSRDVDALIDAICRKLQANREHLKKSLHYGRLVWRIKKNEEVEIDLELKL
jgi:hypothetical protein